MRPAQISEAVSTGWIAAAVTVGAEFILSEIQISGNKVGAMYEEAEALDDLAAQTGYRDNECNIQRECTCVTGR